MDGGKTKRRYQPSGRKGERGKDKCKKRRRSVSDEGGRAQRGLE